MKKYNAVKRAMRNRFFSGNHYVPREHQLEKSECDKCGGVKYSHDQSTACKFPNRLIAIAQVTITHCRDCGHVTTKCKPKEVKINPETIAWGRYNSWHNVNMIHLFEDCQKHLTSMTRQHIKRNGDRADICKICRRRERNEPHRRRTRHLSQDPKAST